MKLRLVLPSSRPPPRWLLGLLVATAAVVLSLGQAPTRGQRRTGNYSTLYLSGATSSLLSGSDTLVPSAGSRQPGEADGDRRRVSGR